LTFTPRYPNSWRQYVRKSSLTEHDKLLFSLVKAGYGSVGELLALRDDDMFFYLKTAEHAFITGAIEWKQHDEAKQKR
jgi:hypothetical protein